MKILTCFILVNQPDSSLFIFSFQGMLTKGESFEQLSSQLGSFDLFMSWSVWQFFVYIFIPGNAN